ncbi:uncharacterized protein RCO7_10730 [Rhynchosporium graminicola]|uniref:Uncharacterized protein n=1 Tax=Rhynchosporium graminicola TaxID=2792576 RepID=A0A1E1L2N7_9HELO|nr:uncharacterized protein RCO7_10730 [Rhynchosporium commune]
MARPTDSDDIYAEADRERQRELRAGFVRSGIYMSSKHSNWKKGQRGVQTGENAQEADMAVRQQMSDSNPGFRNAVDPPQSGGPNEKTPAKNTARKVNYSIQIVSPSTYYTFTGETLESSRGIQNVRWRIDNGNGPSTRSRYTYFRIASENAPFAVLFGRDLIFSEDIFSFNEAALILTKLEETEVKKDKEENRKRVEAEAQALATA